MINIYKKYFSLMEKSQPELQTVLMNECEDMFYLKLPFNLIEEDKIDDIINSVKDNLIHEWKEYKKLQKSSPNKKRTTAFVLEDD